MLGARLLCSAQVASVPFCVWCHQCTEVFEFAGVATWTLPLHYGSLPFLDVLKASILRRFVLRVALAMRAGGGVG